MWNEPSLAGRRVLVTAGADGIGLEITRAFAAAGARVFVCDVQGASLERLASELPSVKGCVADVSSETQVAEMFALLDRELGGLDVLVNNAGIAGPTGGVETLSLADWERTLAVNITGQFLCARLAVPRLRQGTHPSIINLSSAAGHLGMPGRSPYSDSKWAVIGFTKTLAIELGRFGVTVNAIAPGFIETDMIAQTAERMGVTLEEFLVGAAKQIPVARTGVPADIAHAASFFVSEGASYTSGQVLYVAGGPTD